MSILLEDFETALSQVLATDVHRRIVLKPQQKSAIQQLVLRGDLLAVLPTGFGKSLIFQIFIKIKEIMTKNKQYAIVVCPLESIIADQIEEASIIGFNARSLKELSPQELENGDFQLLFGSAEEVLSKRFLAAIKKQNTPLYENLAVIIVDESHTVETWTGRRHVKRDIYYM